MGVVTLPNQVRIAIDPFDETFGQVSRYSMHRRLAIPELLTDLPRGYTIENFSVDRIRAFGAVLFQSFMKQPERKTYPRLVSNRGCSDIVDEMASLPGFLEKTSYLVMYKGVPVAGIITSRSQGCVFGQIHLVAVAPRHRRKGLGSYLVKRVLNEFRQLDLWHASLHVLAENRNAVKFYRVMGFRTSVDA